MNLKAALIAMMSSRPAVIPRRDAAPERKRLQPGQDRVNHRSTDHGDATRDRVLYFCRDRLGYGRLGPRIKEGLLLAAGKLERLGLIAIEEGELFLTPARKNADVRVVNFPVGTHIEIARKGAASGDGATSAV